LFAWASFAVGACLVIGCDVHDEPLRPAAATTDQLLRNDTPLLVGMLNRNSATPAIKPTTLEYVDGFDAGLKRAATESKPLLVICRASWCRWSAEMTQGTLADPRIIRLASRFVCVMIDADRHADTCRSLGVTAFPTVLVLTGAGEERLRSVGRPAKDKLADALEATLTPTMAARPELPLK
jgi:thiol:disulfide interchange protein